MYKVGIGIQRRESGSEKRAPVFNNPGLTREFLPLDTVLIIKPTVEYLAVCLSRPTYLLLRYVHVVTYV